MRRATVFLCLLLAATLTVVANAAVRLPAVFCDHMVLQQQMPIAVWGWADPGEKVVVVLRSRSEQVSTAAATADKNGRWLVKLPPVKAGGPYVLVVEGTNRLQVNDVLVGEVWLCSGQSNMAMPVAAAANFEQEKAAANLPAIRMFTVVRKASPQPQQDCEGNWVVCSPETVGQFSATAYFFGRTLHKELGVPVGLINSSWGGTPVEAWTCPILQSKIPGLRPLLESWERRIAQFDPEAAQQRYQQQLERWKKLAAKARAEGKQPPRRPRPPADPRTDPHRPGNLYNGMIVPLAPFTIRGAIWYQGEANSKSDIAHLYGLQLRTMITNWRNLWAQGDFPFIWVQLPNFRAEQKEPVETTGWVIVREQMFQTLSVPNTGMAVTIDIGEANNIHPKNKQEVGRRLALWALARVYGKDIVYSGPLFKRAEFKEDKVLVYFDHVGKGLKVKGDTLKGFAIAGPDKKFVFAQAKIVAPDCVEVWSPEVKKPAAVRYAWADNPICNLYNSADLPAGPFRTDNWDL